MIIKTKMIKKEYQLGHLFYSIGEILHIYKIEDFLTRSPDSTSENPKNSIEEQLQKLEEKTATPESKEKKIKETSELVNKLFHNPSLTAPQGRESKDQRTKFKWYFIIFKYTEIKEMWNKFITNQILPIIYEKCRKYNVPFDVAFLCLHESKGNPNAVSRDNAVGYWQFTEQTAKEYGLIIDGKDYRKDKEKSTNAAISLLKNNYNKTKKWDEEIPEKFHKNISENDRWLYAMYMYNGGNNVKKIYISLKGKIYDYVIYQDNEENKRFIDMIFARRLALQYLAEEDSSNIRFGQIISNKNIYYKK